MLRRVHAKRSAGSEAGFSLLELMVAITIFAVIALVAYAVYDAANWTFKRGSEASDAQQRTRIGFDRMISDIRLAGYDYNSDGDQTPYSDSADEQIEYLGPAAIAFRANFDYEDDQRGREYEEDPAEGVGSDKESGYETSVEYLEANPDAYGFPIVTTANDEIVIYALVKDGVNECDVLTTDECSITLKLDTTKARDAERTLLGGSADREETITICNVALVHDDPLLQPPFTLERITLADQSISATGSNCISETLLTRTPLADGIRSLSFDYFTQGGDDFYCKQFSSTGCAAADQVPLVDVGGVDKIDPGDDGLTGRSARANVRRVAVELIGMTESPDFRYTDPEEDDRTRDSAKHRKTRLLADINPPNLGRVGQIDLNSVEPGQVTGVSACSGQCGLVKVTWEERPAQEQILGYSVNLYEVDCSSNTTILQKVGSKFVTGRTAYDQPGFLYTTFTGDDDPDLLEYAREETLSNRPCLAVQVIAKNVFGDDGDASDSNNNDADGEQVTPLLNEDNAVEWAINGTTIDSTTVPAHRIYDETRPEGISNFYATGIDQDTLYTDADDLPDANGNSVSPETSSSSEDYPLVNKIELSWNGPVYTLYEESNTPGTSTNAVDPALGQGITGVSGPGCFVVEDPDSNERTPLTEINSLASSSSFLDAQGSIVPTSNKQGRYLIFRSTEPNFKPTDANLIAVTNSNTFTDRTVHHFSTADGERVFQYTEAFPVENCVKYYYRVRVADDCWDGEDAGGVDPAGGDYRHPHLSPFFPPLNADSSTDSDVLDDPSDAGDPAMVGYARPAGKPEKVRNLLMDAYTDNGTNDDEFFLSFDLPKIDTNTAAETLDDRHITVGAFRVWGVKNTNSPETWLPTADPPSSCPQGPPCGNNDIWFGDIKLTTDATGTNDVAGLSPRQAGVRSLRIGHHDEDGDNQGVNTPPASWNVELPDEDETAVDNNNDGDAADSGDTGLLFVTERGSSDRWYFRVLGVQCLDTEDQSFLTGAEEDKGVLSDWIKVPCVFGEAINGNSELDPTGGTIHNVDASPRDSDPSASVLINGGTCPTNLPQRIVADVTDADATAPRGCQARLVLSSGVTGDSVSSRWKFWSDANCVEIGTSCPDDVSFWSSNTFCWDTPEVQELMSQLRGQDISVRVEVRESRPVINCLPGQDADTDACQVVWKLPCIGESECSNVVPATECIVTDSRERGNGVITFNPVSPQDDFTGSVDPISGLPNGLPDGTIDCDQSAEWEFAEACANGDLDITDIDIDWRSAVGGACTGDLLRAFWDYAGDGQGVQIFESDQWPGKGEVSGSVDTCDLGEGCSNEASCFDPDPDLGCLYMVEGGASNLRLEFDLKPTDADDPEGTAQCFDSAKNAEIRVSITYVRTTLGGAAETLTQTFEYSPTQAVIPDPCEPCDKDGDGLLAQVGQNESGVDCNTLPDSDDCDDLDPEIGTPLSLAGTCCDLDGDGFKRLGTADDGTICADPDVAFNICPANTERPGEARGLTHPLFGPPNIGTADCDDLNANVKPGANREPTDADNALCSDGIDNDCDCYIDGGDAILSRECLN